jgi:hypothetical protein
MDVYTLKYKNVMCTQVDWENKIFVFIYKKHVFKYHQKEHIDSCADTDHIKCVISEFLKEIEPVEDVIINSLDYINKAIKSIEDILDSEENADDKSYYEGVYDTYLRMLSYFSDEVIKNIKRK